MSGIDVSRRSISHARDVAAANGLPARFRRADHLRADLGRGFDLAMLVHEDFCAMAPVDRGTLVRQVRRSLRPGGSTIDTGAQVRQFWNWMACLTPAQVDAELRAARLVPTAVLGDLTGAPYDVTSPVFAVVARRP